jgi:hypothetical protein
LSSELLLERFENRQRESVDTPEDVDPVARRVQEVRRLREIRPGRQRREYRATLDIGLQKEMPHALDIVSRSRAAVRPYSVGADVDVPAGGVSRP